MVFSNPFKDKIAAKPGLHVMPAAPEEAAADESLRANEFYFEIRLCEMYLRKQAEGGRTFVPRMLAITQCQYEGDGALTLPVAVGEQILSQIDAQTGTVDPARAIAFSNCLLAGPMPYRGGDIGFFGGLYRLEQGNWADSVFNLVSDVTGGLGLDLSKYVDIGRKVADQLPGLLGADTGDWRLGHYGPIYKEADGFFDRYLVLFRAEGEALDTAALHPVEEHGQERLLHGSDGERRPFADRDYLLIRLRSRRRRGDYSRFGFYQRYNDVKKFVSDRESGRAKWAEAELMHGIATCPDLTETHKLELIGIFKLRLEEWRQALDPDAQPGAAPASAGNFRGAVAAGVETEIGRTAALASEHSLSGDTVDTLLTLSDQYATLRDTPAFTRLGDLTDEASDDAIDEMLAAIDSQRIVKGKASDLADAIKIGLLS